MSKESETLPQSREDSSLAPLPKADLDRMYGNLDAEHFTIPRLTVLESLSPEVKEKLGYPGDFFVTSQNLNLGTDPIEIVTLLRFNSRIRWKPMAEGGGLLCQARDGKTGAGDPGGCCATCALKEWGTDKEGKPAKPQCSQYENFLIVPRPILQEGGGLPWALAGTSTRLKGLRDFNTMLMGLIQKRLPLYHKSWLLKSVEQTKGSNTYHVFRLSPGNDNQPLPAGEQAAALEIFQLIVGRGFTVDHEPETET